VRERVHQKTVDGTQALISIHQHAQDPTDWQAVETELSQATPQVYQKREPLSLPPLIPTRIRADLGAEAKRTVSGLFGMKKKREAYIAERVDALIRTAKRQLGKPKKSKFEEHEARQEKEMNAEYQNQFDVWKAEITSLLEPTPEFIEERLEDCISQIQLPIDFLDLI
jgi:hypothetical protein